MVRLEVGKLNLNLLVYVIMTIRNKRHNSGEDSDKNQRVVTSKVHIVLERARPEWNG